MNKRIRSSRIRFGLISKSDKASIRVCKECCKLLKTPKFKEAERYEPTRKCTIVKFVSNHEFNQGCDIDGCSSKVMYGVYDLEVECVIII